MKTKKLVAMVGDETLRSMFDSWMRDIHPEFKGSDSAEVAKVAFYCGATAVYALMNSPVIDEIEEFTKEIELETKRMEKAGFNGQV